MGWTYYSGWTRKSLIAERTQDEYHRAVNRECLKHCYRGNAFSGVLWTVWEITRFDPKGGKPEIFRYIGCDLLQYRDKCWGYKDMCESMHPYYYSCPLSYLDMVKTECFEWRQKVRQYHAEKKETRDKARSLKVGDRFLLKEGWTLKGELTVTKVKPLRAYHGDSWNVYKIPARAIGEVLK